MRNVVTRRLLSAPLSVGLFDLLNSTDRHFKIFILNPVETPKIYRDAENFWLKFGKMRIKQRKVHLENFHII